MKELEVSAGILIYEHKVLCAQRGENKHAYISRKFEFPGGKIEEGENPKQALHRELIEEMDVVISEEDMELFYISEHIYPDFKVRLHCYLCPVTSDKVNLKEHLLVKWSTQEELKDLDWAMADYPVVEELIREEI